MVDHKPTERARYIDTFFANVNWPVVERRFARHEGEVRRGLHG